jgi:hypothetical protein
MEKISVRALGSAIRLIREPVVVTYSYPRNHPLYAAGEDCGVYVPMAIWERLGITIEGAGATGGIPLRSADAEPIAVKPRG